MSETDPRQMPADDVIKICYEAYAAADPVNRHHLSGGLWVMNRPWYDAIRAAAVTPEQELERARAHATLMVEVAATWPRDCPACKQGPFADMTALSEHAIAMADPTNREPSSGDWLLGVRIEVRDHGGVPHLEHAP